MRSARAQVSVLTIALTVLLSVLVGLPLANAAGTGGISGTVTEGSQQAAEGVCVRAVDRGGAAYGTQGLTNTAGHYEISGLDPADYYVRFEDCSSARRFVPEYHLDAPDLRTASSVPVSTGVMTVDAVLVQTGAIAGTVRDAAEASIPGICVHADGVRGVTDEHGRYTLAGISPGMRDVTFDDCRGGRYASRTAPVDVNAGATATLDQSLIVMGSIVGTVTDHDSRPVAGICVAVGDEWVNGQSTRTDIKGQYTLPALTDGDYKVSYTDCSGGDYATEWWDDAPDAAQAAPVQVSAGAPTTLPDVLLADAGRLAGTVLLRGAPVSGGCVGAYPPGRSQPVSTTRTAADGSYQLGSLRSSDYLLFFMPCHNSPSFPTQWSGGAQYREQATSMRAIAGQTTTVATTELVERGSITGEVTDADGPVAGVCVDAQGSAFGHARTDAQGRYTISDVWPGRYSVAFAGCDEGYQPQRKDGVTVSAGSSSTVNAVLVSAPPPSSIAGVVTDDGGRPVPDACVSAQGLGHGGSRTDADGRYTLALSKPGSYVLHFWPCSGSTFVPEYYDDQPSPMSAHLVTVAEGAAVTDIDARVTRTGALAGSVTGVTGAALPGACVHAYGPSGGGGGRTGADGTYTLTGLAPGEYTLRFDDCNVGDYLHEYYSDARNPAGATPVTVQPGQTTTVPEVGLAAAGRITGAVTLDPSGAAARQACVTAHDRAGTAVRTAETDAAGRYALSELVPSTYRLSFGDCWGDRYVREWHSNATSFASATAVVVASGERKTIDAALDAKGSVGGRVTDGTAPVAGICVTAFDNAGTAHTLGTTDVAGDYSSPYLAPGQYAVEFRDCAEPVEYATTWWRGATSRTTATPLTVVPGEHVGAVDAVVTPAGAPSTGGDQPPAETGTGGGGGGTVGSDAPTGGGTPTSGGGGGGGGVPAPSAGGSTPPAAEAPEDEDEPTPGRVAARDIARSCPEASVPAEGFGDVAASNPHAHAIGCLVWWQVANGQTADRFAPGAGVTRAAMASFVARAIEASGRSRLATAPADAFRDDNGSVHQLAINQLAAAGIVGGNGAGSYTPDALVTRGQMARFLAKAAEHVLGAPLTTGGDAFADDAGSVFEQDIDRVAHAGITGGRADGTYGPAATVTREQMASFLARTLDVFVEDGVALPTA